MAEQSYLFDFSRVDTFIENMNVGFFIDEMYHVLRYDVKTQSYEYEEDDEIDNAFQLVIVEYGADNIEDYLDENGYLKQEIEFIDDGPQGTIKIALKYDAVNKVNAIKKLIRISTPGMRKYTGYKDMPRVINGLGIAILSTSKGVMTNKEAADLKIGGEVLCYIY